MSTESFPYLSKRTHENFACAELGVYYVGNAMRRPNVSSPEWECLFKPNFVLEQFKAMETALTVDIFLDVFHKILNTTCHRPPTRHDKGGVFDEMQLLDWIQ